jgi:sphinganine-1-phosphate aldolase
METVMTTTQDAMTTLPYEGMPRDEIMQALDGFKRNDIPWNSGRILGYTYDPGEEARQVAYEGYFKYLTENGLDWTVFPSMHKLETDIIHILRELLRGDENVVGSCTTGGTESILCAVKSARDWSRKHKPHITKPEMVLPATAHGAFHKACLYLGIEPVLADYHPETFRADVDSIRKAINENTILIVASAPGYAQGVIDPIRAIGEVALEKDVLFHVDGCVGGIHLSFMRRMGYDLPDFDFSVPGVTSISADMHKYGYAPKNISSVLYRSKDLRFHQYFSNRRNTCYALVNSAVISTKSGGPYAGAWAILHYLGESGYQRIIKRVEEASRRFVDGINAIDGLRVLGNPDMCMFSFTSDGFNIFELGDKVREKGFYMQPQFSNRTTPANLHISMEWGVANSVEAALDVLREAVDEVKANPNPIAVIPAKGTFQKFRGVLFDTKFGHQKPLRNRRSWIVGHSRRPNFSTRIRNHGVPNFWKVPKAGIQDSRVRLWIPAFEFDSTGESDTKNLDGTGDRRLWGILEGQISARNFKIMLLGIFG